MSPGNLPEGRPKRLPSAPNYGFKLLRLVILPPVGIPDDSSRPSEPTSPPERISVYLGKEIDMFELAGLGAVLLIGGIIFVAAKVLFALFLIPLKLGIGALKLLLFVVVGIPLLAIGCVAIGITLPFLVAGGLVLLVLVGPFVLLAKVFS